MPTKEVININNKLRKLDSEASKAVILDNLHLLTDSNKEPFKALIANPQSILEYSHSRLTNVYNTKATSTSISYNYIPEEAEYHGIHGDFSETTVQKAELSVWFRETYVFAGRVFVWVRYIIKKNEFLPDFPKELLNNKIFQNCLEYKVDLENIPDCVKDFVVLS